MSSPSVLEVGSYLGNGAPWMSVMGGGGGGSTSNLVADGLQALIGIPVATDVITVPIASFTYDPHSGQVPIIATLTGSATNGPILEWEWDFGDGGSSAIQSPTHEFTVAGTYTISFRARNADGWSDPVEHDFEATATDVPGTDTRVPSPEPRFLAVSVMAKKFAAGSGTLAVLTPVAFDTTANAWKLWTAEGSNDTGTIRGFVGPDPVVLSGSSQVLGNVLMGAIIHLDDIPLPEGEDINDLLDSLRECRSRGYTIQTLTAFR